ncbi:trigger factor-like [Corticium candelabrum]|uniref:trigger factor-like n=1 Tax=Corticium candelabrum TaxID=121492 RepID=UPI002E25422F|nr:trigger factor-like [Corticium candelabrum]
MASTPFADSADISHRMRVPERIIVTGESSSPASSSFTSQNVTRDRQIVDNSVMETSFQSMITERPIMSVPEHIRLDKNLTPSGGPRTSSRAERLDDTFEFQTRPLPADGEPINSSRIDKETPPSNRQTSRITVYIPEETEENGILDKDEEDDEDEGESKTSFDDSINDDINDVIDDENDDDDDNVDRRVDRHATRRIDTLEREVVSLRRQLERIERGMTLGNSPILASFFVLWLVIPTMYQLLSRYR